MINVFSKLQNIMPGKFIWLSHAQYIFDSINRKNSVISAQSFNLIKIALFFIYKSIAYKKILPVNV